MALLPTKPVRRVPNIAIIIMNTLTAETDSNVNMVLQLSASNGNGHTRRYVMRQHYKCARYVNVATYHTHL